MHIPPEADEPPRIVPAWRQPRMLILAGLVVIALGWSISAFLSRRAAEPDKETSKTALEAGSARLSDNDWKGLGFETAVIRSFRDRVDTEGKLAIDEDNATSVLSPYSGKVLKILARIGDKVKAGQPLFTIEASDMIQTQNDYLAARTALNTAQAQLRLAESNERRQREMYNGRAAPLRDLQEAVTNLEAAKGTAQTANSALEAVAKRLALLGKSPDEIASLDKQGAISPEVTIRSPIDGIVMLRKVGPGQFVSGGSGDPLFLIDDIDPVWLLAFVREADAGRIALGQPVRFRVAGNDDTFTGTLDYVATTLDPATRRLLVRATIPNANQRLKTEMFAAVTILVGEEQNSPAVPRAAIIMEGQNARVWVVTGERQVAMRPVEIGIVEDNWVQVRAGLNAGDRVVTRGTLFVDQMRASATR